MTGRIESGMTSVRANGVDLGIESFGREDDPLVLLVGGTTMLSWPDALCERLASGGRRVVRYDLRDSGASTTLDPENPAYDLRDLVADAAALVGVLGAGTAHLGGVGVGGMVAQVAALDHPDVFSALTLVGTRPVAPAPVDEDLPDHDPAVMAALFSPRCRTGRTGMPSRRSPPRVPSRWATIRRRCGRRRPGSGTGRRRAIPRCTRRTSSGWCSPGSIAPRDGGSGSVSSTCPRSWCTVAPTRSSRSATARPSPPRSLRRDCSSSTTWVPPCGTLRPTRSLPPCSRSDRLDNAPGCPSPPVRRVRQR